MHSHQVQIILILLSFILSLFLFIASAKYAEWARVMVSGQPKGSWLSLVFYIGTVPLLSVTFNALHLLALHFEALPSLPPPSAAGNGPRPQQAYTASPSAYLLVLFSSAAFTIAWLGQSSLCTACELAPILAGTQGNVPAWCPQSKFRDTGRPSLPRMLASLALVKDATGWAMVPLSAALVECARRQWQRARIASERDENWDPGLREYDWKNGTVMSQMPGDGGPAEAYELEPVPKFGRRAAYSTKFATETKVIEMGSPPTRRGTVGKQGDPFRPLNVGMGYESRI